MENKNEMGGISIYNLNLVFIYSGQTVTMILLISGTGVPDLAFDVF
jgi:hypothetical protein